jgi:hypothetical protein
MGWRARLPVSGWEVLVHAPSGAEDVYLAEVRSHDTAVAIELLERVTRREGGAPVDWGSLAITDMDFALLTLRQLIIGDYIRTTVSCTVAGCSSPFDVSFRISEYLQHHVRSSAHGHVAGDEPGWFQLSGTDVFFRIPTARDLVELDGSDIGSQLTKRCIRAGNLTANVRHRVERAMQKIAPTLYGELQSLCCECGAAVSTFFNPTAYVLEEFAQRAVGIYDDVHLLAHCYHWSEEAILALPGPRRARYVDLVWGQGGAHK